MKPIEIILLVTGLVFIISSLVTIFLIPSPTESQFWVIRVILSLGAACIGAIIPGFIELDGSIMEVGIRAGGAIALFLIVYLLNPPQNLINALG